eukprot:TRINITY_DN2832_c2_g1_i1.p1 TRINITY_DN2832_c2_g1~~TRINITY_DN2832_c2_g1_i1.p1  ORF type:complete len:227 (-),score=17.51 TRINITY_DN2832_c2_g1_i1:1184-1864(-)
MGLRPCTFITIGCPHLGVRRFTYVPVPAALGTLIAGKTGEDLMLADKDTLLLEMATPTTRFMTSLGLFRRRALYANLWGDFMVPFGTAAIEPSWGAGIADEQSAARFLKQPGVTIIDETVISRKSSGLAARKDVPRTARSPDEPADQELDDQLEAVMGDQLDSLGWTKFAVGFNVAGTLFPMAHNKIAALRRQGWRKWAFSWLEGTSDGDDLMLEMARYISDRGTS